MVSFGCLFYAENAPRTKRSDLEMLREAKALWSHLEQREATWMC